MSISLTHLPFKSRQDGSHNCRRLQNPQPLAVPRLKIIFPEGRKFKFQENSKNLANTPYLVHAGVEAVGLLDERDVSQVKQDPLVLENGIRLTLANL